MKTITTFRYPSLLWTLLLGLLAFSGTASANLASNKPVACLDLTTFIDFNESGHPCVDAVDGNDSTYWRTWSGSNSARITLDLGNGALLFYAVDQISLRHIGGTSWTVFVSGDGRNYTQVAFRSGSQPNPIVLNFSTPLTEVRWIKVDIGGNSAGLYELQVQGQPYTPVINPLNLALNKPIVTCLSTWFTKWEETGHLCEDGVDGIFPTYYRQGAGATGTMFYTVDLQPPTSSGYTVGQIVFKPVTDKTNVNYKFFVSADNSTFIKVFEKTQSYEATMTINFSPELSSVRYVKVESTQGSSTYRPGLYELQVFEPVAPLFQTDWSDGVPTNQTACEALTGGQWNSSLSECIALTGTMPSTGWTAASSADANLTLGTEVSVATSVVSGATLLQTSDTGSADAPNAGGFNAGTAIGPIEVMDSGAAAKLFIANQYDPGDGHNGASTLPGIINQYAALAASGASSGSTSITVDSTTGFVSGDEILVIQMSHATEAGTFEFKKNVTVTNGTTLSFSGGLVNSYLGSASGGQAQVVSVPNFTTYSLTSGQTLTASPYDTSSGKGGVLIFRSDSGTAQIDGTISVNGIGFSGGQALINTSSPGYQGEGPGGTAAIQATANNGAGGGGGGQQAIAGGFAERQAGGGGGSHVTTGGTGLGWTDVAIGGIQTPLPGIGGNILFGNQALTKLYLGAGGGSGSSSGGNEDAGAGGGGGGIIYISAEALTVNASTGSITANGNDGGASTTFAGGSGGGAGGSVYLGVGGFLSIGSGQVTANGGTGSAPDLGNTTYNSESEFGQAFIGGNGSAGRIRFEDFSEFIPAGSATATPVSWYRFNETSGTAVNDEVASNPATNIGTAAIVAGKGIGFGNALSFTGTDHVKTDNNFAAHQLTNMTLSALVKPSNTSDFRPIFRRGENAELNYRLQLYQNSMVFDFDAEAPDGFLSWTCTACSVSSGVWSHVAVTYKVSDGKAFIYINGVQAGTNTFPAGATPKATGTAFPRLHIGRDVRQSKQFIGDIDEVRIFNTALSPTDIALEAAGEYLNITGILNTFTSAVIPVGLVNTTSFGTLSWNPVTQPTGTSITVSVQGGQDEDPADVSWGSFTSISNGGGVGVLDNSSYIRYQITLDRGTAPAGTSPTLDDISVGYGATRYPPGNYTLLSSPFDTANTANGVSLWSHDAITPMRTSVDIEMRTSPDLTTWTGWADTDGAMTGIVVSAGDPSNGSSSQTEFINTGIRLGQTFTTSAVASTISSIAVGLPNGTNSIIGSTIFDDTSEQLTMNVYNSPAKTTLLAGPIIVNGSASFSNKVTFNLPTALNVAVNTQYYWEVTMQILNSNWILFGWDGSDMFQTSETCTGCAGYLNGVKLIKNFAFEVMGAQAGLAGTMNDGVNDRYFQYRALINTDNQAEAVLLNEVNVAFGTGGVGGSAVGVDVSSSGGISVDKSSNNSSSGGGVFAWISNFVMFLIICLRMRKNTRFGLSYKKQVAV